MAQISEKRSGGRDASLELLPDGRFEIDGPELAASRGFKDITTVLNSLRSPFKRVRTDHDHHADSTVPPSLNIVIQIVGSRGDVQPFIPIAHVLSSAPYFHRVRIATHGRFKAFVEGQGLEFFDIGGDPEALMSFMVRNPGLIPGRKSLKNGEIGKRRQDIAEILDGTWRSCFEPAMSTPGTASGPFVADAIIANPPSYGHIHCAERLGVPLHIMFTMPWTPTRAFPHPLANVRNSGSDPKSLNSASFRIAEMMIWAGLGDVINKFRESTLGLEPINTMTAAAILQQVPHTYLWSEGLIPKPLDWKTDVSIAGFSFLSSKAEYEPSAELAEFLESGPPPIYIGFGSIPLESPERVMSMILEALKHLKVRAIVSRGWAKLQCENPPPGLLMVDDVPHDWLFPRVSCVVHHGGAGTTSVGLKMGKPTVVVPFFGDQPFWGAMIKRAGAGPPPIAFSELNTEKLVAALNVALSPETQSKAQELQLIIASEHGSVKAVNHFHNSLHASTMRCCVDPVRTAVWQMGPNGHRLSTAAATVLHESGSVDVNKLQLVKHRDWIVDQGPSNPIDGVLFPLVSKTQSMLSWPGTPALTSPKRADLSQDDGSLLVGPQIASNILSNIQEDMLEARPQMPSIKRKPVPETVPMPEPGSNKDTNAWARGNPVASPASGHELEGSASSQQSTRPTLNRSASDPPSTTKWNKTPLTKSLQAVNLAAFDLPISIAYGAVEGWANANELLFGDGRGRAFPQITGIKSGSKEAALSPGRNIYEGIKGLYDLPTQAYKKNGAVGALTGTLKGVGNLVMKFQSSAIEAPAFLLKGVYQEFAKLGKSEQQMAQVSVMRRLQGVVEANFMSVEEKAEIIAAWDGLQSGISVE